MNEANLDHLLQVTAPRSNWQAANPPIGRDDQPAFDDHLAQASTPRAPAEPPRPRDMRPSESSPPGDRLPPQGEATRSEVEETADTAAAPPAAENIAQNDDREPEETNGDGAPAETAATDAETAGGPTEHADGDAPREDETDEGNDERVTELAAVTEAVAVAPNVVFQLSQEKVAGEPAAPTSRIESAESNATEVAPTNERPPSDGSQPLKPVNDPAKLDDGRPAEAPPAQADAEQAAPARPAAATVQVAISATKHAAEKAVASTPANAKVDRSTATPKRQRAPNRETTSTSDRRATISRDEAQQPDAPPQAEHPAITGEKNADEPRESEGPRPLAGRQSSRSEAPSNNVKSPLPAAVHGAPADAVLETAKPDATDESVRPAPQHAPRSDALLHPLVRLQRGGGVVARTHGDTRSEDLPQVDAARFVSRVAKAFHTAQERGGALQLRLSPPELGALRLELLVQDGVLAAKLETETPAARRVLLDHLPVLRDRLAEQNIRIERFDVDVRQEGGGHSPSSPQHGRHQQPHHGSPHRHPTRQPVPTPEPAPATPATASLTTDTQINLVA
jgi:flagellar hook-length control protein FliK